MKEYVTQMDDAFFFTPEYKDIFKFRKTYNDEAEILADKNNYVDAIGGYRIFEVEYLDTKGFIPMVTDIKFEGGYYVQTVKGMRVNINTVDFGVKLLKAMGMDPNPTLTNTINELIRDYAEEQGEEFIKNLYEDSAAEGYIQAGYVDEDGKQVFYDRLVTHVYACLNHYFGTEETGSPTSSKYATDQINYPAGQSTLVDWDNSGFSAIIAGLTEQGKINTQMQADKIFEQLNDFAETDSDLKDILNSENVRVFIRTQRFPTDLQYYVYGYDIDNNTIVTTQEDGKNQHYGVLIKHYKAVYYETNSDYSDYPTMHKKNAWSGNVSISDTLYNYPKSGWYNITNGTRDGGVVSGVVIDSIGYLGDVKPYQVIGTTPSSRPMAENYTNWIPNDEGDYPVGEGDTPSDIWRGVLPEHDPIRPTPIAGIPPVRIPDPESDDVTPDIDAVEGTYGLFTVYKLNFNHLLRLGNWLWHKTILDEIATIFKNNPLDAVISLHQIYMDVSTYTDRELKFGFVSTGITDDGAGNPVRAVNDRFQEVKCGYAVVPKYFFDVRDYQTKVSIFLPFIGIRELDINEVLGSKIEINYQVDVYTGDCTATLMVNRGALRDNKVLYTFQGNCASQLPLTGADKSRMISNIANVGMNAVSAVASGGATLGKFAGSVASTMLSPNVSIQKSGNISGNHGAMAFKKPYLIIERPQPYDAADRGKYIGKPCNVTLKIGNVSGYAQFNGMHVDTINNATAAERIEIQSLLEAGVIV